jgi:hypothetical protein
MYVPKNYFEMYVMYVMQCIRHGCIFHGVALHMYVPKNYFEMYLV